ncbi:hypothetical protein Nham_0897 [Nitrobacter hamburgensis X14]|uniref:Uncharacterized protein n=1 Tax=Nitrobacter hamburgensis (strain DSM 10229 / NCIMB 13809 / X14) TaxID=323097 RepID=Q1QPT8_NITHX|nr:hypothetical protein [Nitrobacter hamburgensis]ABE61759.1 hypothetical protein Nham_0897 [Nitrobacter hamburgensis X14]
MQDADIDRPSYCATNQSAFLAKRQKAAAIFSSNSREAFALTVRISSGAPICRHSEQNCEPGAGQVGAAATSPTTLQGEAQILTWQGITAQHLYPKTVELIS